MNVHPGLYVMNGSIIEYSSYLRYFYRRQHGCSSWFVRNGRLSHIVQFLLTFVFIGDNMDIHPGFYVMNR